MEDAFDMTEHLVTVAKKIFTDRYSGAAVMFLAGSIVRGEGTASSDLDLVVVYERLPTAFRESFYCDEFPVEAFVHDPETLEYFIAENTRLDAVPSLAQMISEGIEIPESSPFSRSLKRKAVSFIEKGPPEFCDLDVSKARYNVTGLVDDIRHPRSRAELVATGTELYQAMAVFYFRANGHWSAQGKSIPRLFAKLNADLCARFCDAFDELFANGQSASVIALAEYLLTPFGGFLFDGYRNEAPAEFRKPTS